MTDGLKTFALNSSRIGVSAKFSGGDCGFQFVTAEIAAVRAEVDTPGVDNGPEPVAAEPFLDADLLEATVLT